ncbi:PLC-like phosphodiesterase [Mycena alexandri]|uniref:PLC-like phosphodiesterase n=1 Tax=Mycena alexandri TaxID=1745969 RepID=A0AAD6XC13_9AGAR|nr:PLC-like phosphodiesterase [Mycena alexandri]
MGEPIERKLPECWGHRGASARFPENTMASFEAAIRDGVDGIESDVHVSKDGVVVMFHDPTLDRTTNFKGAIKDCNWYGVDGMEHARTKKEPQQSIPTLIETLALLMLPENIHIHLNADIKAMNDPDKLFTLMHTAISAYPQWETLLAPRILLGIWHPRFIQPAKDILPYCRRSCISFSLWLARKYLWDDFDCLSIWMNALMTREGERFRADVKKAGKKLMVFTVNEPNYLAEVVRWNVDAIITDKPNQWLELRSTLQKNYEGTMLKYSSRIFLYTTLTLWTPFVWSIQRLFEYFLRKWAGPFVAPFSIRA